MNKGIKKKQGGKITVASTMASLAKQEKQVKDKKLKEEEAKAEEEAKPAEKEKLADFIKYYKEIGLVPENEWNAFFQKNTSPPPVTFRLVESYRLCPSHVDTVPGVPSQARVLARYIQKKYADVVNQLTVGNKVPVKLAPLPWYPKELGWMLNVSHSESEKYLGLKEFDSFIRTEKNQRTLQGLETWSMFPPTLLDVKPQHVVLDMCAAPGYIASQVCEMMNSEPLQSHTGLLILNDLFKAQDRMHYQWTQGSKVIYTFFDAKVYPDFYSGEKQTIQNQLKFDRIMCDVKCSVDGTMRKNVSVQESWTPRTALTFHSDQLAILRRALELVKVKGRVLYTTTSLNPIENEAVVMAMIKEAKGSVELFDSRKLVKDFKIRPGMTSWKVMTEEGFFLENFTDANEKFQADYPATVFPPPIKEVMAYHMERCVRVLPHDNDTTGFFCAVLVKTSELPWIRAKIIEEMKAKRLEPKLEEPKARQYGYNIKLKCHVAPTEIEWTTEITNQKLQTITRVSKETFGVPAQEMDPSCKPRQLIPEVEQNFVFCEKTTEEWLKIKEFFKISDDFDPTNMVMRHNKTTYFQSCPMAKSLVKYNKEKAESNFSAAIGTCIFFPMPELWNKVDTTVPTMMSHEGLAFLYPFITKQLVNINSEDLLKLAFYDKVKIETLSEKAQTDLKEADQGCVLFVYRPKYMSSLPNCNITFVGARGDNWCLHYKDGRTSEWKNTFRLADMEREDYGRKLQEEKLMAALEKDKKDKEEKMET
ncbi:RNA cytosine-C(5)-methyltransferase NSUN2-like [Mercenaria mercenaria]|uniref:RNA cytosine-C(5)-methyltransferase NSUN2-like n=1 Tax=Mercenaria mercenaria TaxID=6596 RepID=UPI00234EAC41|nr:RNA cytosine-C(5)-methyltransferase NSUN2-like [Mercenaria mercenaria]